MNFANLCGNELKGITMKPSVLVKSAMALALTVGFSATASASCGNNLYCGTSGSTQTSAQYVPFSSTASTTGNITIPGLGSNERLSPTSCPVNVNGLQSGQSVLGCYQVERQQATVSNVRYHYGAPNTVRHVRPIVYVRYPVPTPVIGVPYPVPTPIYRPGFHQGFMPGFRPGMCGGPVLPNPIYFGRCGW